jgi:hypothetical protein
VNQSENLDEMNEVKGKYNKKKDLQAGRDGSHP